ncbi:hypothetical protein TcasGA2_TC008911 [Tribolium castaneum]|uniref:Uncharacterized protein n=1 Tax=Tribolium castaneum TaxID=7070 RepID=D6WQG8_TRICA|nr:hypothetical protein TcasGA2_TC008911 [Tribolium castaneum]
MRRPPPPPPDEAVALSNRREKCAQITRFRVIPGVNCCRDWSLRVFNWAVSRWKTEGGNNPFQVSKLRLFRRQSLANSRFQSESLPNFRHLNKTLFNCNAGEKNRQTEQTTPNKVDSTLARSDFSFYWLRP